MTQKKQLLADITVAAKSQDWSKVEVQGLIILTKPILAKLLVVFRRAANGTTREDRVSKTQPKADR